MPPEEQGKVSIKVEKSDTVSDLNRNVGFGFVKEYIHPFVIYIGKKNFEFG